MPEYSRPLSIAFATTCPEPFSSGASEMPTRPERTPILHVAPWVDEGRPDGATIEWFASLDRDRWAASLIATQPSPNRRLHEIEPFAEEAWDLPDLMPGGAFPAFIVGFVESRQVEVLHIMDARLAFDLLPDIACLQRPPVVVVQMHGPDADHPGYVQYVTRRYGNLVDAFSVAEEEVKEAIVAEEIPPSRVETIAPGAGGAHAELYERLLAARPASSRWRNDKLFGREEDESAAAPKPALRLPRETLPERSVGVMVPCYRHGIFLGACIESIKAQTLQPAQIVIVDDGSDDPETIAALDHLDDDPAVEVIRQPTNRGPSAARNRALEALHTSYVLPIDADDKLLPDALERMLALLEAQPEEVGFVYPHAQHFGNRSDFVRLPAYNLWLLMHENYCPAPALFDRRVFAEDGVRYPEEIVVGHEDWDLILQLGERGVQGHHADGPTFLYRRQGFSRVNAVDYGPDEFHEAIERRHPGLYGNRDSLKAEWAPALSIVLLDDGEEWRSEDLAELPAQTCTDLEVLARTELAPDVRAVASAAETRAGWLQDALDQARGRWVCVLGGGGIGALRNRSFAEHTIYSFQMRGPRFILALGRVPGLERPSLSQLDDSERQAAEPVGIAFERRAAVAPPDAELGGREPLLAEIVLSLQTTQTFQWRYVPDVGRPASAAGDHAGTLRLGFDRSIDKSEFATLDLIAHELPRLTELTSGGARRWEETSGWTPPGTRQLCRHVAHDGRHRIIANHRYSPPGYSLEFDLGAIYLDAFPGMRRLVHANHSFELVDDQNKLDESRHALGYVGQQPLPQLDRLELRAMPESGEKILVAGERDPLYETTEPLGEFGWIEAFPLNPQDELTNTAPWRAIPLRRHAGDDGRRHRYSAGADGGVELGSLFPYPGEELVALHLRSDGRLASDLARPGRASRDPRRVARWIAETTEDGTGAPARETGARLRHLAATARSRRLIEDSGTVLGGLRRNGGPDLYPLFSTTHPVTGDQLVTCAPLAAIARGYLQDGVLGYLHVPGERAADLR